MDYLVVVHPTCARTKHGYIHAFAATWAGVVVQFAYYKPTRDWFVNHSYVDRSLRTDLLIEMFGPSGVGSEQAEELASILEPNDTITMIGAYRDCCVRQQYEGFIKCGFKPRVIESLLEPTPWSMEEYAVFD